ncbi:MAG: hypothetical protein K5656_07050 [Lachnospiraceae bacterium]|nr:hypothetical protein [Lachnospiraceae bacterium]
MPDKKTRAELIEETYNKQRSIEDKVWFIMNAFGQRTFRVNVASEKQYKEDELEEKRLRELNARRKTEGKPELVRRTTSRDLRDRYSEHKVIGEKEDLLMSTYRKDVYKELLGNGTPEEIMAAYRVLGNVTARLYLKFADDYEEVLKTLPLDTEMREQKALYITWKSDLKFRCLFSAIQEMSSGFGFLDYISNDEQAQKKIGSSIHIEDNPSLTLEEYLSMINASEDDKRSYVENFNCKLDEPVYDSFFRIRYRKEPIHRKDKSGNEIYDSNIFEDIKKDYASSIIENIITLDYINVSINGAKEIKASLTPRNQRMFDIGNSLCSGHFINDKGEEIGLEDGFAKGAKRDEFKKWVESSDVEGGKTLSDLRSKNIERRSIKELNEAVYKGTRNNFRGDSKLGNFYERRLNPELLNVDPVFIKGAILELEATKTGNRKSNSEEYDKMLTSLKKYEKALSAKNIGLLVEARRDLANDTIDYLKDKHGRTIRHEFGKQRYEIAFNILYAVLNESTFKRYIETVNRSKKAGPNSKHYIDYDKTFGSDNNKDGELRNKDYKYRDNSPYARIRRHGREQVKKLQAASFDNAIKLNTYFEDKLSLLDAVFKMDMDIDSSMMDKGERYGVKEYTDYSKKDYKWIGEGEIGDKLSDKDFAAIAFVGTLTPDAVKKDERFKSCDPNEVAILMGDQYTTAFMSNRKKYESAKYLPVVMHGRSEADKAFTAYSNGDKKPLANLISYGISYIAEKMRNCDGFDQNNVAYAEMLGRMKGMMNRDPELTKLAREAGLTWNDQNMADYTFKASEEAIKFMETYEKHTSAINIPSDDVKIERITDIALYYVSIKLFTREKDNSLSNPACAVRVAKLEDGVKQLRKEGVTKADAEDYIKRKTEYIKTKYHTGDRVVERMFKTDDYNLLRNSIKKAVKVQKLHKVNAAIFKERHGNPLDSDGFYKEVSKAMDSFMPAKKAANVEKIMKAKEVKKNKPEAKGKVM